MDHKSDRLAYQPWHRSFDQVTRDIKIFKLKCGGNLVIKDTHIASKIWIINQIDLRIYGSIDHLIRLLEISRYLNLNIEEIFLFIKGTYTHCNKKIWMTNQIDLSIYLNIRSSIPWDARNTRRCLGNESSVPKNM